jgi:hypothetical protein
MKTPRELNNEHDNQEVIRPKDETFNCQPLAEAIATWYAK